MTHERSDPRIRAPGQDEAPAYAAAAERFFRETYGHDTGHAAVMESHCADTFAVAMVTEELCDPAATALIAESGGAIIGLSQGQIVADHFALQRLYVDRDWQGRGIAQNLFQQIRTLAVAQGALSMHLGVWKRNDRAIAFYRRQGFVAVGTVEFLLAGVPQADVMMRLDLA